MAPLVAPVLNPAIPLHMCGIVEELARDGDMNRSLELVDPLLTRDASALNGYYSICPGTHARGRNYGFFSWALTR